MTSTWKIEIESNLEDLTERIRRDDFTPDELKEIALALCEVVDEYTDRLSGELA